MLIIGIPFFLLFIGARAAWRLAEDGWWKPCLARGCRARPVYPDRETPWYTRIVDMLKDRRTWTTLIYLLADAAARHLLLHVCRGRHHRLGRGDGRTDLRALVSFWRRADRRRLRHELPPPRPVASDVDLGNSAALPSRCTWPEGSAICMDCSRKTCSYRRPGRIDPGRLLLRRAARYWVSRVRPCGRARRRYRRRRRLPRSCCASLPTAAFFARVFGARSRP